MAVKAQDKGPPEGESDYARYVADLLTRFTIDPDISPWVAEPEALQEEIVNELPRRSREIPLPADVFIDTLRVARLYASLPDDRIPAFEVQGVGQIPRLDWFDDDRIFAPNQPKPSARGLQERLRQQFANRGEEAYFAPKETTREGFEMGLYLHLRNWVSHQNPNGDFKGGGTQPGSFVTSSAPQPGTLGPSGTFCITLDCIGAGLAAHASPAYALTWRHFGTATTPSYGVLPPGAWIFGATSGGIATLMIDHTPVHIPPDFLVTTTCF